MRQQSGRDVTVGSPCIVQRKASDGAPGKRTLVEQVYAPTGAAVQRRAGAEAGAGSNEQIHAAAARGVAGPGGSLPHGSTLQRVFGPRHDLSGVKAHVGGEATAACDDIGANAYATGNQVAFREAPDLHTAAHEAAHVVQQRAGVQMLGGVGASGDAYEQHADQVADLAVRGESAAHLLGDAGPASGGGAAVQCDRRDDREQRSEQRDQSRAQEGDRRDQSRAQEGDRRDQARTERTDDRRDRRTDREGERDRRERRPEGGTPRGRERLGDLQTDWAGRAILERYLFGEGDWDISEPRWSVYMMRSEILRRQLLPHIQQIATQRITTPESIDRVAIPFAQTFAAEVENGEGIVGYQYLHGTNGDVGGFLLSGTSTVTRGVGGSSNTNGTTTAGETVVEIQGNYRWNDMIDPNPQYQTDNIKSIIAEIITLGQAQSYRISINWTARTRVHLDSAGTVVRIEGWPGEPYQ